MTQFVTLGKQLQLQLEDPEEEDKGIICYSRILSGRTATSNL